MGLSINALSKELSHIGNIYGWDKLVKHVALMVLEARRDELNQMPLRQSSTMILTHFMGRILELEKEIVKIKGG